MVSRQTTSGFRTLPPQQSSFAADLHFDLYRTRRRETLFDFDCPTSWQAPAHSIKATGGRIKSADWNDLISNQKKDEPLSKSSMTGFWPGLKFPDSTMRNSPFPIWAYCQNRVGRTNYSGKRKTKHLRFSTVCSRSKLLGKTRFLSIFTKSTRKPSSI